MKGLLKNWQFMVWLAGLLVTGGVLWNSHTETKAAVETILEVGSPMARQTAADVVELKADMRELSVTAVRVERIDERTANMQKQLDRLEQRISKGVATAAEWRAVPAVGK